MIKARGTTIASDGTVWSCLACRQGSVLLAAILALTLLSSTWQSAVAQDLIGGDVNGDGRVDLVDIILTLKIAAGRPSDEAPRIEADVDGDGKVGPAEAIHAVQRITRSMLYGAKRFTGPLPPLATVSFVTKSGEALTLYEAHSGLIDLFAEPQTPPAEIAAAIQAGGGAVVGKIPRVGHYLVQVPSGQEGAFLAAMFTHGWVINGFPAVPAAQGGGRIEVIDSDVADDDAGACEALHATFVRHVGSRRGGDVSLIDPGAPRPKLEDLYHLMLGRMQKAAEDGRRLVLVIPLESMANKRTISGEEDVKAIREAQGVFLAAFWLAMARTVAQVPDLADNTILVLIAGNAGVDLDGPLMSLRFLFPEAFEHIVIVGSAKVSGDIERNDNHVNDNRAGNMVYARGVDVKTATDHSCDGSSFAGPEVASVLDFIWSRNRQLISPQVVRAFRQAVGEKGTDNIIPQDNEGYTPQTFLDCLVEMLGGTPVRVLVGEFEGCTTVTYPMLCKWEHCVRATGAAIVTGSGTPSDPYDAVFALSGMDAWDPIDWSLPQCGSGSQYLRFSGPATIHPDGKVEASGSTEDGTGHFTGQIQANGSVKGTVTLESFVFDSPIVGPLELVAH